MKQYVFMGKVINFSDKYYLYKIRFLLLKKDTASSDFKEVIVVLNLKMSINLDKLHKEFYIRPTLAFFMNEKFKQTLSVSDVFKIILVADNVVPNVMQFTLICTMCSCLQCLYVFPSNWTLWNKECLQLHLPGNSSQEQW